MSAVALALAVAVAGEPAWELVKDADGVKVFARDVPGGRVRELKAQTVVGAPPARVLAVIDDLEHYLEFMPYMVEARRLAVFAGGHYEYQRIDPPLVDMRDYALRVELTTDARGVIERRWREANEKAPPPPSGTVRVAVNRGAWTLEPLDGGRTALTYYVYTDPGGAIPAWAVNKANTTSVPDMLAAVRNRAVSPGWHKS